VEVGETPGSQRYEALMGRRGMSQNGASQELWAMLESAPSGSALGYVLAADDQTSYCY
jgi:hypothetical protein